MTGRHSTGTPTSRGASLAGRRLAQRRVHRQDRAADDARDAHIADRDPDADPGVPMSGGDFGRSLARPPPTSGIAASRARRPPPEGHFAALFGPSGFLREREYRMVRADSPLKPPGDWLQVVGFEDGWPGGFCLLALSVLRPPGIAAWPRFPLEAAR